MKKKSMVVWIAVVAVVLVLFFWVKGVYNSMVQLEESVKTSWSQVENVYQRRLTLIPNLVATVKGYAAHESQTLENVINARANATKTGIDPESLTEENIARYQQMQGEIGSAIGRLLVSVEQYPELKADKNFLDLQAQLEGTENRITVERQKFNEAVKRYNTKIRMFPNNLIANIFGFEKRGYFSSDEGAENAPVVNFE